MKKVGGRFALLALVVLLSVVFFLPSYKPLYQALPDWARKVLELSGRGHVSVEPITSDEWPRPAPPPLYAPIVNFAGAALGIELRPWEEALQAYFE